MHFLKNIIRKQTEQPKIMTFSSSSNPSKNHTLEGIVKRIGYSDPLHGIFIVCIDGFHPVKFRSGMGEKQALLSVCMPGDHLKINLTKYNDYMWELVDVHHGDLGNPKDFEKQLHLPGNN
jgi:hypothetical protein